MERKSEDRITCNVKPVTKCHSFIIILKSRMRKITGYNFPTTLPDLLTLILQILTTSKKRSVKWRTTDET